MPGIVLHLAPSAMAGFSVASPDGGQAFSKDPPFEGSVRDPSPATVNAERSRPMLGITLIAVVAIWATITVVATRWIADA